MSLDSQFAESLAGDQLYLLPLMVLGLFPVPPVRTVSTQATGDDSTVLRAGITAGRVRIGDIVKDFTATESVVASSSGAQYADDTDFASGYALWATAVAVQHRPAGAISIVWVLGDVALLASAAKPSLERIEVEVNTDRFVILGDVLFYRSADTVVDHRVDYERRPEFVEQTGKNGTDAAQDSQSSMGLRYFGAIPLHVALASYSAATAGDILAQFEAPALPFGGLIGQLQYVPTIAGAGASASVTFRPNIKNPGVSAFTAHAGADLALAVAASAIGTTTSNARAPGSYTAPGPYFKPGATIGIELEAKSNTYSDGEGTLFIHIWECVPHGVN